MLLRSANQSSAQDRPPFTVACTLLSEKGVWVSRSLINIDRQLPWRWTKCDVRSVISAAGQGFISYQWWWIIQSVPLPVNTEYIKEFCRTLQWLTAGSTKEEGSSNLSSGCCVQYMVKCVCFLLNHSNCIQNKYFNKKDVFSTECMIFYRYFAMQDDLKFIWMMII